MVTCQATQQDILKSDRMFSMSLNLQPLNLPPNPLLQVKIKTMDTMAQLWMELTTG